MSSIIKSGLGIVPLILITGFWGCSNRYVKKDQPNTIQQATSPEDGENSLAQEPSMRNTMLKSIDELKAARFDYDSSFLTADARATLVKNSEWLKAHPGSRIQAAGHCDERGTVEYNLALGQRRAQAVRKYYASLGISGKRIATISYGKERPVCHESNEECWRQNRRAETLVAMPEAVSRAVKQKKGR